MRWQCQYRASDGKQCENEALYRLHFSQEHPFDFVDTCEKHLEEYRHYAWVQDLHSRDREIRE